MKIRLLLIPFLALTVSVAAEVMQVRIVQTTDLHGRIMPAADTGASWFRVASLVEEQRRQVGADGVLLIDCGDTVQGSFEAYATQGEIAARLLQAMDYDVWVPGNHEIDFGTERFLELVEIVGRERVVCNNLRVIPMTTAGVDIVEPVDFAPWRVFERGGVKIAVIGATASYLDNWHWGRNVMNYHVEPALDRLGESLGEIHALGDIDMIILAIHQGWMPWDDRGVNEVNEIARRYPEIDLILGGHTHRPVAGITVGNGVWYVQAGKHGESIGVVDAIVDTAANEVLNMRSFLVPVNETVAISEPAYAAVQDLYEAVVDEAKVIIGRVDTAITPHGTPGVDCAMSELFCRALVEASGAEFAFHGTLSGATLSPGAVTRADLFRVVPYENGIGVAELTPRDLAMIVHEQYKNRESYVACGIYGFYADVAANGFVGNLRDATGRPLDPGKRYKTAFNSYTVAGGGGRFPLLRRVLREPEANLADTGKNSRDAVRSYLNAHPGLTITPSRWLNIGANER